MRAPIGLACWALSLTAACGEFLDASEPATLVVDPAWPAEHRAAIEHAALAWNLEYGLALSVADAASGGPVRFVRGGDAGCEEE